MLSGNGPDLLLPELPHERGRRDGARRRTQPERRSHAFVDSAAGNPPARRFPRDRRHRRLAHQIHRSRRARAHDRRGPHDIGAFEYVPPGGSRPGRAPARARARRGRRRTIRRAGADPRVGLTASRFAVSSIPTAISAVIRRRRVPRDGGPLPPLRGGDGADRHRRPPGRAPVGEQLPSRRRARRGRRPCLRYLRVGTLTRRSRRGANSIAFSGRIGRRPLAAGRYGATLRQRTGRDTSRAHVSVAFTVVRG